MGYNIKKVRFLNKKGMSLMEVLISFLIISMTIGVTLQIWTFVYKSWTRDTIMTKMRIDLEIAMETIKHELRLSSATYASFYKVAGESEYSAISFPAVNADTNGFFPLTAGGKIDWDISIIYHTYDNAGTGKRELRRTVFTSNEDILTDQTQRETQLSNVVTNGDGSGGPNAGNTATKVMIDSIENLTIDTQAQEFDGYSSSVRKSDNIVFGSVKLDSGNHDYRFEVTGKNAMSSGREMGIDALSISPSGCSQEMETYTPYATSGDGASVEGPDVTWSGHNFLEYGSGGVGDYITFRIYYDTWLEANFDNSVRDNTILTGNTLYVKLPDEEEGNENVWTAEIEAGSASGDATKADFGTSLSGITVRNIISSSNIDADGDMARVKFSSHSGSTLTINSAYIDERSSGQNCVTPAVTGTPGETRIQLYFTDGLGNTSSSVTLAAGEEKFSNWFIFPISTTKNYFVTFYINDGFVSIWPGTNAVDINSYLIGGDYAAQPSWSVPIGHDTVMPPGLNNCISSAGMFATASLEIWAKSGSVTTEVYDTKLTNPGYNSLNWDSSVPSGSFLAVYGRSSSDELMGGASWSAGSISGSGRYAQLRAVLSADPYWTCITHGTVNVSDSQYKNSGVIACSTCGKFLIPAADCPWVDNMTATWPGASKMCDVSGYFAQKPNYGIIKLTVDGNDLIKGLGLTLEVVEDFQDDQIEVALTVEVEPRNTGK